MKICFIGDGRSVHTQRWVGWFAGRHEVKLISVAPCSSPAGYPVVELRAPGLPGTRLARWALTVRRVLHQDRPDVVHSHYINEAGWLGAASGWRPLVITAWGSDIYRAPDESRAARSLNPWSVRRADWVTCDSADQAGIIESWGVPADRVSVIGWGVDLRQFRADVKGDSIRRRLQIPDRAPVVLSPRQWLPNSQIPDIVAAHALLGPDVFLVLKRLPAFEGDHARSIEQAIAASPARDRIRVLGLIATDELPELYAAADVVVSLCLTDGTPVSVLEAMAMGRPIVALGNASLAEWVSEPGGCLVPTVDARELADAIGPYLLDPARRSAAAEHNTRIVQGRADRELELERMAGIYEQLAAAGAAAA